MAFFSLRPLLVDGLPVELEAFCNPRDELFLVGVWPRGMSYASPRGDDRRLTADSARHAIARWFDEALVAAPPFLAAVFGGECYDFFLEEGPLVALLDGGHRALFVDDTTWCAMGSPPQMVEVAEGRRHWPRGAEV